MNWKGALRARALAAAPVTALVGQKVTWVSRPQASALDALTFQRIFEDIPQHMGGFMGLNGALVQLDSWATTYDRANAIIDAAIEALVPAETSNGVRFDRAFVRRSDDLPAEDVPNSTIFRASADLMFHYSTA